MLFYFFGANRLECSEADVKRDFGGFDSTDVDTMENLRGEVKPSGGGGD